VGYPLQVGVSSHQRCRTVETRSLPECVEGVRSSRFLGFFDRSGAWRLLVPVVALAVLLAGPSVHAQPPSGLPDETEEPEKPTSQAERVADVRVSGNKRIETSAILNVLETKPGRPFALESIRKDLRTLWQQRYFSDIKVDETETPSGRVITFIVVEKPLVHDVKLAGNDEIDTEDLQKEIEVKAFQIYDSELARNSAKKIQAKYADKGFFLAEVTFKTKPAEGENQVDVIFTVVEHAKVEVKRVSFLGNKALSDDELKNSIGTQEGGFLSFLTSQGTYKEEVFQRDLLVIQSLYYNKGYINVRVNRPSVALSADKREIYITIPVEEGEPYDFGEIGVSGELLGDDAVVRDLIQLKKGQRFSSQDLQKTLLAVQDHFRDKGYAYVQVNPATGVDVNTRTVDLNFVVQPGNRVTIERIDIVGNTKTRDKVIRRELRISEGELYSGSAIRISKARVTALGFFEAVDITSKQGSRPDTMVLEVAIKEKATGTFQVGLGFSNQEPILLNANVSQNNFLGWGTSAAFMAQLSRLRRIFSISYTDPYFLDSNWTFAFDLFNTLQSYQTFERRALGGTLTGGYQLVEDLRLFLTYTLQQIEVVPSTSLQALFANRFRSGVTSSVKLSLSYDKRDNRLFPTRGYFFNGSVEYANPDITLSQTEFTRWLGIVRFYRPLGAGIVFKVNGTIGYISSPATNPVPVSELFFEGGINSLRGFNFRDVAPRVEAGVTPGGPRVPLLIGGNKELLSNWELEFPIVEDAGLRGVVFYDAGNVYSDTQNFFDEAAGGKIGLLMSVGVGARWFTPLGPLRFEYGIPVAKRPTDPSGRFEFTIGNFF
jgi:outer membrane protein insertion porin family